MAASEIRRADTAFLLWQRLATAKAGKVWLGNAADFSCNSVLHTVIMLI
jgi:hypothetical protein